MGINSRQRASFIMFLKIAKWALPTKDFSCVRFDDVLHNWEASFCCGLIVAKRLMSWIPPLEGVLKFNVDDGATGKVSLARIGFSGWEGFALHW